DQRCYELHKTFHASSNGCGFGRGVVGPVPQPQMETKDVECYVGTLPNRPHHEIDFSHAFRADAPRCSESWIYTARYEIPRSSSAACRPGHLRVRRESGAAAAARCAHDRTADRYPASVERDVGARWT